MIEDNKARIQFFQEKLEYEADRGASLEHLKTRYAEFLKGVFEDTTAEEDEKDKGPRRERKIRGRKKTESVI